METEIEKAKRWLLGNYNDLENLNINFKSILTEFIKEPNTIETRNILKSRLCIELDKMKIDREIIDYLIEDISSLENLQFVVNLKQSPSAEIIKIDIKGKNT